MQNPTLLQISYNGSRQVKQILISRVVKSSSENDDSIIWRNKWFFHAIILKAHATNAH